MEEEPVPVQEPEPPPPSRRPSWLVPALGLLAVLVVWLLSDALIYNPKLFRVSTDKDRMSNELISLRSSIWRDGITPDEAQTKLDSLVRKYPRAVSKLEIVRVQRQIDLARRELPTPPDSAMRQPEWPLILSMPPPKQGR
jgi:hypothetical protein